MHFLAWSLAGRRKTTPLRVLISPSSATAWCESRTTRCWSALAGCTSTNSLSTCRAATCPSSLWCILVSSFSNVSHLHLQNTPPFLSAVEEIELVHHQSSLAATGMMMRTQYEWLFVSMKVTNKTISTFQQQQDVLIFTVSQQIYQSIWSRRELSPISLKHPSADHHEEAATALHRQLPASRLLLPVSGLGLLPHLRQQRREARLQGHSAAGRHRHAADPQRDPAFLLREDPPHRWGRGSATGIRQLRSGGRIQPAKLFNPARRT